MSLRTQSAEAMVARLATQPPATTPNVAEVGQLVEERLQRAISELEHRLQQRHRDEDADMSDTTPLRASTECRSRWTAPWISKQESRTGSPTAAELQQMVDRSVQQAIMNMEMQLQQRAAEEQQKAVEAATRTAQQVASAFPNATEVEQMVDRRVRQAVLGLPATAQSPSVDPTTMELEQLVDSRMKQALDALDIRF